MAPFGRLYSYPNSYRVQRLHAIAAINGLTLEDAPDFQMGVTNRTPEFLAKFPLGKVPAFESGDGTFHLTEGQAIARYVAESGHGAGQLLGGDDPRTRALVEQWSCFAAQELESNITPLLVMCLYKLVPYDEARYAYHVGGFERAVKRLEVAVQGGRRKFLVGEQLTLADIMVAGVLQMASRLVLDKEMREQVPGVEAYLKGIMELPEMKPAFPPLELCEVRVKGQ
ncbi:glutathione S-transferase [Parathielavia appendiculata]|uniref:Glutathione S-transferase n=1 Tax=Parathielavia appendiculata TaxID=2587402 RepID=A0AAN6TTS1_9PEZI|nr:glutathione S-transferase [Parathielavia appendiculata]